MVHKWYKYTINKQMIKRNHNKLEKKKRRYNIDNYNGFMINTMSLFI